MSTQKNILLLCIVILFAMTNCTKKVKEESHVLTSIENSSSIKGKSIDLKKDKTIKLDSVYNIQNFAIDNSNDETKFYFTDDQLRKTFKFKNGHLSLIGHIGRGPFEYIMPDLIEVYKHKLYVWDSAQLKFNIYNEQGNNVKETNTLRRAVEKFDVIDNNRLALYMSGGFTGKSMGVYNISKDSLYMIGGKQLNEDLVLATLKGVGGIWADAQQIFYTLPSSMNIHKHNLTTKKDSIIEIDSPYFYVENIEMNAQKFVNRYREKSQKYVFNNSSTQGLYKCDGFFILKTVSGTTDMKNSGAHNQTKRFYIFYVLNDQFNIVGHFVKPSIIVKKRITYKYTIYQDKLYQVVTDHGSGNLSLDIYKLNINL